MDTEQEQELKIGYQVQVDDNFHFMREDDRWVLGNFATYEEALAAAKNLVERSMESISRDKTADEIYDSYVSIGDDPFIIPFGGALAPADRFSAWDYAKEYAERLRAAWDYARKCSEQFAKMRICVMPPEPVKKT